MSAREAARAIVIKDDALLVMKRSKLGEIFYVLVGGGIEPGESPETALRRELLEEASMTVGEVKRVFIEKSNERFGVQHIFLCEYQGGEPHLAPDSPELAENTVGQNTYEPLWLPIKQFREVRFRSNGLREALLEALEYGFPDKSLELSWKG